MTEKERIETIKRLEARLECDKRQVRGIAEVCNPPYMCEDCDLCYGQGTLGERNTDLERAIEALKMERKKDNRLLKIMEHYGLRPQLKKMVEEVYELIDAIYVYEYHCSGQHILEEYADVQVMLNQIKEYYQLSDDVIKAMMDYKIERQLKRIEAEEKENEVHE